MIQNLLHDLKLEPSRDEMARQEFVSCLRGYILVDMAATMNNQFVNNVAPRFEQEHHRVPENGPEVHRAMKDDLSFKFYSSIRCNAQEMVWRSVIPVVERNLEELVTGARSLSADTHNTRGSLNLDNRLELPSNVTAVDVHLAPGGYHREYTEDDVAAGAIYDNGLNIFAANMMVAMREKAIASNRDIQHQMKTLYFHEIAENPELRLVMADLGPARSFSISFSKTCGRGGIKA